MEAVGSVVVVVVVVVSGPISGAHMTSLQRKTLA